MKQCFKCCVTGVLMNSEHVQLSAQYQTNEHSSLDERENHKVPHLAEELLENDGFWEKENHFSSGVWHLPQTDYVACIPMDGPMSKHMWTALYELNGSETKDKKEAERSHEAH